MGGAAALAAAVIAHYLTSVPWNARLRHPIALTDGRTLRTLADARDMIVSLPERDRREDKWQKLAALLVSAAQADNASLTAIITDRIEEALRRPPRASVRLANDEMEKKPPAPSVKKRRNTSKRRNLS